MKPWLRGNDEASKRGERQMIEVVSATHPQMRKGSVCVFKAKSDFATKPGYTGSEGEKETQALLALQIETLLKWFVHWPCELDVTVGVSKGRVVCDGQVKAYDGKSHHLAVAVIEEIALVASNFVIWFPDGEFETTAKQIIIEVRSYPHAVH